MTNDTKIHIATIVGSVRPGNFTYKALKVVEKHLDAKVDLEVTTIDPSNYVLGFPGQPVSNDHASQIKSIISKADGVILSTPEYHGSYSSVLKLVIENLGYPSVLKGKPVSLLGVASGQIGAVKSLEALRSVCSHVGALVLPGPVSISGVQKRFDEEGNCIDPSLEEKLQMFGENLYQYVEKHCCPKAALENYVREKQ
jgi:FMN reductase